LPFQDLQAYQIVPFQKPLVIFGHVPDLRLQINPGIKGIGRVVGHMECIPCPQPREYAQILVDEKREGMPRFVPYTKFARDLEPTYG
jgi:hypothetical protein